MTDWGPLSEFTDEADTAEIDERPGVQVDDAPTQRVDERPMQHDFTTVAEQPTETTDTSTTVPDQDTVTCPECGTTATVTLNRRQAEDFCRNCDFPLFWTPTEVMLDRGGLTDESLRRLPGTTGRARTASVACPHCSEPNPVSAIFCVRCDLPMRIEAPPPPAPAPVYVPPPPVFLPPPKRTPWWVWVLVGVLAAAIVTVIVLFATGTF